MPKVKTSGLQVQLYSPLLLNLLRRLRAGHPGLPFPHQECFEVAEPDGRTRGSEWSRGAQVKSVVCVRRFLTVCSRYLKHPLCCSRFQGVNLTGSTGSHGDLWSFFGEEPPDFLEEFQKCYNLGLEEKFLFFSLTGEMLPYRLFIIRKL